MYFYGSITKEWVGASVWIIFTDRKFKVYSFKLTFECTNNVAEYEALLLGLVALKDLEANRIDVYGDLELFINQVNGSYKTKHPRMTTYRNEVWDMLGNFFNEHRVMVIPIIQNKIIESLDTTTRNFKIHVYSNKKYEIEVVNRPPIHDNSKYW